MSVVPDAAQRSNGQSLTAAISSTIVGVIRDYTGRGPTRARTTLRDNLLVVMLEDSLTKGERALVRNGRAEKVIDIRKEYQEAMREECISKVSQLTGRTVVAMMSTNNIDPDLAVELFVLDGALNAGEGASS